MIKIIDSEFKLLNEFERFCSIDSFGTRIYSHFLCYGHGFDFVDFWVQISESGCITSAISCLDNDFVLCFSSDSDFIELSAFINFQSKNSITYDIEYDDKLKIIYDTKLTGDILTYFGNNKDILPYEIISPEPKVYHELLLTCESEDFIVPDYFNFLSDVTRRISRNLCVLSGIIKDNSLVSCAMTVSQTKNCVILGAVATHPDHRKHGYAGSVVKTLAEKFRHLNKVYIYTTVERNTRFYESLGFTISGKWVKCVFGG
ncbi:MAG: GNAT family N-acetyltransferase [Ruminococcaceae bacterium]|nr:GNAT family N-acetyltransferase [Oscillospiraceae bacterium]